MASLVHLTPLLLLIFNPQCLSLSLTSSTPRISRNGTRDFHLNCSTDDHHPEDQSPSQLVEIRSLRISKLDESNRWRAIIEIDSDWETPRSWDSTLTSSFHNGTKGPTSLKATWPIASNTAAGHYACDIMGYTQSGQGVWQRTTVFVDVEAPLSLYELLNMMKSSEKRLETALEDIHTNKGHILNNERKINETDLDQEALGEIYYNFWPQGKYSLLEPRSGCPVDVGVVWNKGWIRVHTESRDKNNDHVSDPAHMQTPIMERDQSKRENFMTLRHCRVIEPSKGREWPNGSYCISRRKDKSCPRGFGSGWIEWDDRNSRKITWGGFHIGIGGTVYVAVGYCCRSDSSANTPIHLPRSKPFYLFRYKGTCQQVHGMSVTSEFMFFDSKRRDGKPIPDGSKDGIKDHVKLELCYYEPI